VIVSQPPSIRVLIIGVGLIGTSLALALKRKEPETHIIGIDRDAASLDIAKQRGAIDDIGTMDDVKRANIIVLAIPVRQMPAMFEALAPHLLDEAIVIDVGSTKQDVIAAAEAVFDPMLNPFVPCHPIAGREQHGPAAADATLFEGKRVVITPQAGNRDSAIAAVRALWEATGAEVVTMSAKAHDAVFAAVSHLPHMLAFAMVHELATRPNAKTLFAHAASGFRDFTRIASSSPEMWRDIALNNRDALLSEFDAFLARAQAMRELVATGDAEALQKFMRVAEEARGYWLSGQYDQFNNDET
jgi:prephenate dehydrogenase